MGVKSSDRRCGLFGMPNYYGYLLQFFCGTLCCIRGDHEAYRPIPIRDLVCTTCARLLNIRNRKATGLNSKDDVYNNDTTGNNNVKIGENLRLLSLVHRT